MPNKKMRLLGAHFHGCDLLQHYEDDILELELYFVIVKNEYGEQTEEELLPGEKNHSLG